MIGDNVKTPLNNLLVTKEYLETFQNNIQWRTRLCQTAQDTTSINITSELGDDIILLVTGTFSNNIAEGYINGMMNTAVSIEQQEEPNFERIRKKAEV